MDPFGRLPAPSMPPARFRDRIRPYLPGTVLELRRLWRRARAQGYELGAKRVVGPYCPTCGPLLIWLFGPDGELDMTADVPFLREHWLIVSSPPVRNLYTFPRIWKRQLRRAGAA